MSYTNAYIWNLEKMVPKNLFARQQWRNRHRQQTFGHGERGGEGERYGKKNMKLTLSYVK